MLLIVVFALWEVRLRRRGHSPLVPPHLFSPPAVHRRRRSWRSSTSPRSPASSSPSRCSGRPASGTPRCSPASCRIPFAIGSIIGASQSNRLSQRLGRTVLVVGTAMVSIGLVWVWLVLRIEPASGPDQLGPAGAAAHRRHRQRAVHRAERAVHRRDRRPVGGRRGQRCDQRDAARRQSAIGIAVIGSVLFGSLVITGPDTIASGFTVAAANAMAVSAAFSVTALLLVFVLPRRTGTGPPSAPQSAVGPPEALA